MEQLDGLMKLVGNELDVINRNGKFRTKEEIDNVYKLVDIVKDSYEIWCMMEELDGGSSSRGAYERRSRDSRGRFKAGMREGAYRDGSYRDGSYRDGSYRDGSYRDGSYRDGSYYAGKEEFKSELRELMQEAPDEQTRQSIQQMLNNM